MFSTFARLAQFVDRPRSAAHRQRLGRAVRPACDVLEPRALLSALIDTALTGNAAATYTNQGSVSSQDSLGNTYQFTVGGGAAINVSLQIPSGGTTGFYSVYLSNEPYGTPGDANVYASASGSNGTIALPSVTGNRSQYYYVTVSAATFSPTAVQLPYTLTIATGAGEPQADIGITSAALINNNTAVQFTYSALNDPGPFTVSLYRSPDNHTLAAQDDFASETVTPGAATSGTAIINAGTTILPSASYPYLLVDASGVFENNYANNVFPILVAAPSPSPTTTSVTSSQPTSLYGQPVTFTATVAGGTAVTGAPTGTVQFVIDGANYGSPISLSGGTASIKDSALAVGDHSITAIYGGDTTFSGSTSSSITQTVNPVAISSGDVSLDSASVVGSSVSCSYHTIGSIGSFTVGLYEAAEPAFESSEDTLVTSQTEIAAANSSGADTFVLNMSLAPNPAKPYLLVVVNPQSYVQGQSSGAPVHMLPAYLVSQAQLTMIMPALTAVEVAIYLGPLNEAMEEFQINTPKREAAFLAQAAYESGQFQLMAETAPKNVKNPVVYFDKKYNGKDGNKRKGDDGYNYRGQGPLQLTGRTAYATVGMEIHVNILATPSLVSTDPSVAMRSSAALWTDYKAYANLNGIADSVDASSIASIDSTTTLITRYITGAFNTKQHPNAWPLKKLKEKKGLDKREAFAATALNVLA